MDREALKRTLTKNFEQSLEKALDAVERAPDGQWIAASEWQIRQIFQELMSQAYQQMLQAKMDAAPQAAFSPSEPAAAEEQGQPRGERAQRGR